MIDLQSVPHFIVFSEGEGFESDSWTVQCEILQYDMNGGGPQDEDPMPEHPIANAPLTSLALGNQELGLLRMVLIRMMTKDKDRIWKLVKLRDKI